MIVRQRKLISKSHLNLAIEPYSLIFMHWSLNKKQENKEK